MEFHMQNGTGTRQRVCFILRVRSDKLSEYRERHRAVWPEMLEALSASGWHNYSLFLDQNDGTLVGYLETPDFESALAQMATTEVNRLWQSEMAQYFEELEGVAPDQGFRRLEEVFNLEDQLEASRGE